MTHTFSTYVRRLALAVSVLASASCTDLTESVTTEITDANFNPTAGDLVFNLHVARHPVQCNVSIRRAQRKGRNR